VRVAASLLPKLWSVQSGGDGDSSMLTSVQAGITLITELGRRGGEGLQFGMRSVVDFSLGGNVLFLSHSSATLVTIHAIHPLLELLN
jgi:hypothetical protein